LPTLQEFNPRVVEFKAGELKDLIGGRTKHGIFPDQARAVGTMSNEELVRFRIEDPISATGDATELSLTGGHHRTAEIATRVEANALPPDTPVRVLLHD
jgi:hypothetical protein